VHLERLWYGADVGARLGRAALGPFSWAYRAITGARNACFDAGLLRARSTAIPAISVGNLTVGGTGKTPFAAYLVVELLTRGARPCVVLRGYGGDEEQVHRKLTPQAPVVVGADRVAAIAEGAARGCDVAVLDDAFQHRRAARVENVVLVSADVPWVDRLLPAGPLREPVGALRRASLLVITCKAASKERAQELAQRLTGDSDTPVAIAMLRPHALVRIGAPGKPLTLDLLEKRRVLVVAGIGNPKALVHQLEALGAEPVPVLFPDHHRYTAADVKALITRAAGTDFVVCTLKDAVKLEARWPDKGPTLNYVSQRVELVSGEGHVQAALDRVLAARAPILSPTAG
jgi:tetraacyldisaccharide 4'-kinase